MSEKRKKEKSADFSIRQRTIVFAQSENIVLRERSTVQGSTRRSRIFCGEAVPQELLTDYYKRT
jgi:hypothetical protein